MTQPHQQTLITPITNMQGKHDDVPGGITNNDHDNTSIVASAMASKRHGQQSERAPITIHPHFKNKASKHVKNHNDEGLKNAIIEFDNGQPHPTIHELSNKYKITPSVLELYVTKEKSKRLLFEASVGNKQRQNKTEQAQESIRYEGLPSTDKTIKMEQRRERDAKQKRWRRRQMHLQKQVDEHKNEGNKKVTVWSGNIENGKLKTATKQSTFFGVTEMGKGKQQGDVVPNAAIVTFDGENDLEIVQEQYCKKEEYCEAAQVDHAGAKYFSALRLLTIRDMVCIKWPDRKKEEWLPKDQVKDPPPSSRSTSNLRNYIGLSQIYETMKRSDDVTNNEIHTYLPFSNFSGFISLVELNLKKAIREDYGKKVKENAKEEAKKEKKEREKL